MTTSSSTDATTTDPRARPNRNPLFDALVRLASLAVFLQSVWAGMIIREAKNYNDTWVNIHDWGARTAFVLAIAATIVGLVKLRARRDLVIGAALLATLIVLESYIGGIIGDRADAVAVHIPLGFAILALAVWLPMRITHTTH